MFLVPLVCVSVCVCKGGGVFLYGRVCGGPSPSLICQKYATLPMVNERPSHALQEHLCTHCKNIYAQLELEVLNTVALNWNMCY
jgi:hypothetical protein